MKKNTKRFVSLLLAAVLCLSMTTTAFATETDSASEGDQTELENSTADQAETKQPESSQEEEKTNTDKTESNTTQKEPESPENTQQNQTPSQNEQNSASAPESGDTKQIQGNVTQDDESEKTTVKAEVNTETEDDNVVVDKDDKPYLALGADLTSEQQAKVLSLMGIDPANLTNYDVVYVTNDMEHKYLDAYLSSSTIGTRALSSVLIMEGKKGSGIQISTKNISYCTVGMYKNALATAGLEDAEVIVAGPTPISGTAALIGALEAYTKMTGEEIQEESLDAAMNELVVTGKIADAVGGDKAQAEEFMAYVKQEVVKNGLDDEESISEAIDKGCEEFNINLSESEKKQLLSAMKKISDLDLDWNQLKKQASDLYDRLDQMGLLSGGGFWDKLKSFFSGIGDFFKNIFK